MGVKLVCSRGLRGAFAVPRNFQMRKSAVCRRPEAACAHPSTHRLQKKNKLVWLLSAEKGGLRNAGHCFRVGGDQTEVRQTSVKRNGGGV